MSIFLVPVCCLLPSAGCLLGMRFALCEFPEFLDFLYLLFYYDKSDIKIFFQLLMGHSRLFLGRV